MDIIIAIFTFIFGSVFASFFGVIIYRVPNEMSIVKPDSHCGNCGHVLSWYENIPIFSYLILGGKCKECKTKIGFSSFMYELIGGVVCLLTFLKFGISVECLIAEFIVLIMLLMAGYDYKTNTILDIMWIIQLVLVIILFLYRTFVLDIDCVPYLISFAIGSGIFIFIKLFGLLILKKDILGTGDVIVFGISSILFNPIGILISLVVSCVPGSIIELIKLKTNKTEENQELCFLPYLCFGLFISFLYTSDLINIVTRWVI